MSLTRAMSRSTTPHGAGGKDHPRAGPERNQFRSAVASMGRTAEMLIEFAGYDRPTRLASVTTMLQAGISYTLLSSPWPGHADAVVRPGAAEGAFKLLGPLIIWMGRRQEQRIWASLKQHLETARVKTAT
jgi:hypothetical protein